MKETSSIEVRHNIEVAHRLTKTPGKCQNIHGHSMWVEFEIWGELDDAGLLAGIDYGSLKKHFRHHLDTEYDHHLLLNRDDPFARGMTDEPPDTRGDAIYTFLPGLQPCTEDPTTENIAKWIGAWGVETVVGGSAFEIPRLRVTVHETKVNIATWEWNA